MDGANMVGGSRLSSGRLAGVVLLVACLFVGASGNARGECACATPTRVGDRFQHNVYWAGEGYWNRRHAAKLKEIADGPKEYDFVFVGDSITHNWEGWNDPLDVEKVTAAHASGKLKFPNGPGRAVYDEMKREFRLLNLGVGGDTTQNVLWRLENGELDGYRTRGVMLMIGTNNGEKPEDIAAGVKAILRTIAAKQPGARTILLPIFPCMKEPGNGLRKRNEAVNGIIRRFADGEKVVWLDFNAQFLNADGTLSEDMMPDLLHPLEKGYRIWRSAVEPTMREIAFGFAPGVSSVWVKGKRDEINGFYGFAARFRHDGRSDVKVRYAAASLARVWVNGRFAGYGPARAPEGYARTEELPIAPLLRPGENVVAFEVLSPRVNAFDLLDRPPFLRAEVVSGGEPLAVTGKDFKAVALNRVRKTSRFSYQRGPAEVLDVTRGCDDWRTRGVEGEGLALETVPNERILPRGTSYPKIEIDRTFRPTVRTSCGRDATKPCPEMLTIDKVGRSPLKGYAKDELEVNVYREIYNLASKPTGAAGDLPIRLSRGEGVVLEGAAEVAGFPRLKIRCLRPAKAWLLMDEYAGADGIPNPLRLLAFPNAFGYRLPEVGEFEIENFDVTAFKAAHLVVDEGEVELADFEVRTYGNPHPDRAEFKSSDPRLDAVFAAAKRSLKWNGADFYTDCPGRERGIYFGDTIFTGRGGDVLMGDLMIERSMFEAFALPEKFPAGVPDGMVPMLYPGDTTLADAHWIPNFGMWSVVQLADHVRRSGDRSAAEAYRRRAMGLLGWFRKCRNADGLLEKIPGWVFVEWSDAAKFTQDVSYLTNMTYVKFLTAMAEVYGLADCAAEAERAKETIRRQSWTGEWFSDNAVRQNDGSLKTTGECTETAQYFAFFSGVATPERDPDLWKRTVEALGPMRKAETCPRLYRSNLLFGYSIRFVLLSEAGLSRRVLEEVRHCFSRMAERTGTLWEGVEPEKGFSCCHGFPSMAAWLLARDALGVRRIDRVAKQVDIALPRGVDLEWCEGTVPVSATESAAVSWKKVGGRPVATVSVPSGWTWREAVNPAMR